MSVKTLTFLAPEELRIIKQVVIVASYGNNEGTSIGYILYERKLDANYQMKKIPEEKKFEFYLNPHSEEYYPSDNIDSIILNAVKNTFPKSVVRNHNLFFNLDKANIEILQKRPSVDGRISITPDFSQFDVFSSTTRSFDGLEKAVKIYCNYRMEDLQYLIFKGYYDLNNRAILDDLDQVLFI